MSYTTTYHRRDVTTSLKTFLKCDSKQPKKVYQYHADLFSTYNDLLRHLVYAWRTSFFFFSSFLVSSEKLTHVTTIVFYSNLFKFLGFKSSLINKNFQLKHEKETFFLSNYSWPYGTLKVGGFFLFSASVCFVIKKLLEWEKKYIYILPILDPLLLIEPNFFEVSDKSHYFFFLLRAWAPILSSSWKCWNGRSSRHCNSHEISSKILAAWRAKLWIFWKGT